MCSDPLRNTFVHVIIGPNSRHLTRLPLIIFILSINDMISLLDQSEQDSHWLLL